MLSRDVCHGKGPMIKELTEYMNAELFRGVIKGTRSKS
jgi:hypothetical protein